MEQTVGVVEQGPAIEPVRETQDLAPTPTRQTIVRDLPTERSGRPQAVERVIVRHSEEIGELVGALADATLEFGDLERTETAKIEKKAGGSYTFEYETLADVIAATRAPLARHGLVVMQFPFPGAQSLVLRTMLLHKSSQWIYNDLTCALDGFDPKSVGSAITYLSRYARKALLGLAPDDDDDAAGVQPPREAPPKPAQRTSAKPADAPPRTVASTSTVGKIASLTERGTGVLVKLDSGLSCATRDEAMIASLKKLYAEGETVEVTITPSTVDPAKYAPTLTELTPLR